MSASQREATELEARAGRKHVNPAQDNIIAQRKSVQHAFGTVARALATGDQDDKRLAVEVAQFVKQMPPIKTRHAEQAEALQRAKVQQGGQSVEQAQQPGKPSPEQGRGQGARPVMVTGRSTRLADSVTNALDTDSLISENEACSR